MKPIKDIKSIMNNHDLKVYTKLFLFILKKGEGEKEYAFFINSKKLKKAVFRNYLKRVLRVQVKCLKEYKYFMFILRSNIRNTNRAELKKNIFNALNKLNNMI